MFTDADIGTGAHVSYVSDSYPYTIVAVKGKTVTVRRDHVAGQKGDYYGAQKWEIQPDENGLLEDFSLRKNGRYYRVGSPMGQGARLGRGRSMHQDPHF